MADPQEVAVDENGNEVSAAASQASIKHIGRWRELVSTTNWEKGKIITEWRQDLIDGGAAQMEYSDEAWSQLVGDVTSQHVGRLRRVHERFHATWPSYEGLYWTHFLAALDWDDAEMWLEGALQNHWSVSKMRLQRWETLGSAPDEEPLDSQIVSDESVVDPILNEDRSDLTIEDVASLGSAGASKTSDATKNDKKKTVSDSGIIIEEISGYATELPAEPLESLDDFPDDFVDAFEDFRHVILDYKRNGWKEIKREDVVQSLDSLRLIVLSD